MKHGNKKGKAKPAPPRKKIKAASPSKASQSGRGKKVVAKAAGSRPASKSNGKARDRNGGEGFSFSNPVVAAAFKRAVKKYPTAFRRLTD